MAYVLGELQHYAEDFIFILKVSDTGNAVAYGFDRGYEVFVHDPRLVLSVGIGP